MHWYTYVRNWLDEIEQKAPKYYTSCNKFDDNLQYVKTQTIILLAMLKAFPNYISIFNTQFQLNLQYG
jgi:GH25 family lysozyme M1 (1,4-beta-N-acetylmuramidase)